MEEKKSNRNTTNTIHKGYYYTLGCPSTTVYHFESLYPWYLWREGVPPYLEYIEGNCISGPAVLVATFHTDLKTSLRGTYIVSRLVFTFFFTAFSAPGGFFFFLAASFATFLFFPPFSFLFSLC